MKDLDIRRSLHAMVLDKHRDEPGTLVVDELGLSHGEVRVDVAVINGRIHGYEIKSERDTLERLPGQINLYSRTLNRATLVVSEAHTAKAMPMLPEWWGVLVAVGNDDRSVSLVVEREETENPSVCAEDLARLLWRDEALSLAEQAGCAQGIRSKSRETIYRRLVDCLTLPELEDAVRASLKARCAWRADAQRT